MTPSEGEWADHERRVSRLEAWMDDRLVTRDVLDIHMAGVAKRLETIEDSSTWLMRFVIMSLIGVVLNGALLALSLVGK